MLQLIALLVSIAAILAGYTLARRFVRERLRFVDAVQRRSAPGLAGAGAGLLASGATALLPLVGLGTAFGFGLAVALGVAAGARDTRTGRGGAWLTDGR